MECITELIERYFEAALSREDETALKAFLASEEGQAPEYDEVRAVMGYFAAGRSMEILRSRSLPQNDRKRSSVILSEAKDLYEAKDISPRWPKVARRVAAIAASLALIFTLGVSLYNKTNVCVSYVSGQKVTDKKVVMNDVDNILADLLSNRTDMEELLNDFFDS